MQDEDEFSYVDLLMVKLAAKGSTLAKTPESDNWVDYEGGLPAYIEEVAKSLHEKRGMTIQRAIATAVSRIKKWAAGEGDTNPDTKAKAAAALAQWEKMKASSNAKPNKK